MQRCLGKYGLYVRRSVKRVPLMAAHCRGQFASPREHANWTIKQSAFALFYFSEHGPFTAYLKRFYLSDSDQCSCGGTGTALHYATECALTGSWHMKMPTPNFEQEWLKRAAITSSPGINFVA
ncbi:hypothetical protein AVEN_46513-1 [Araneus ventricosus]|uniref:Uncharacterized protein n=1 Tax=Araneus ventricosus TaxID=182803 RepID=A0A4Y2HBL5_ARAVE|nr:hypothetical protein AVEN_46513-1 [Araneus ventricosus]